MNKGGRESESSGMTTEVRSEGALVLALEREAGAVSRERGPSETRASELHSRERTSLWQLWKVAPGVAQLPP